MKVRGWSAGQTWLTVGEREEGGRERRREGEGPRGSHPILQRGGLGDPSLSLATGKAAGPFFL